MNLFFDVDYTILGVDGSLRPRTQEIFHQLTRDSHSIYIWSGMGIRTADVERHDLGAFVSGIYEKPLDNFEQGMQALGIPVRPDLVVDDYPEIVAAFGGILIRPYYFANANDREMDRVYDIITSYAQNGHSDDSAFRLRSNGPQPPGFL